MVESSNTDPFEPLPDPDALFKEVQQCTTYECYLKDNEFYPVHIQVDTDGATAEDLYELHAAVWEVTEQYNIAPHILFLEPGVVGYDLWPPR